MNTHLKLKRWSIIGLGLILTVALVILVWNKEPTIYPYVIVATALSSLLAFTIIGYRKGSVDRFSTTTLIFIVFLFLRNVQFIATHYRALEPGDVSYEYAVINIFSQMARIFVIPPSAFTSQITMYSSWPVLHTFSSIFADVLGMKTSLLPVVLPAVFSLIGFLFVYLIIDKLTAHLKLNKVIVPLSLLFYAISPEAIQFGSKFVRNSLAAVFILIEFYLVYKYISRRDPRTLALIILNAAVMIFTHHYSSFIFTAYLLLFAGLTFVLVLVSRKAKLQEIAWGPKFRREAATIGIVGILSAVGVFLWWNQVATMMELLFTSKASQITMIDNIGPYIPEGHYPESLTPSWVNLLWVRDSLLYIPVFFGFAWLLREKFKAKSSNPERSPAFYFLTLSLICFGVFFLFEMFISHVEPYRVAFLGLPFITFCSALVYTKLLSKGRWPRWLAFTALVFVIVSSFLGLPGHRHAPIHLYCSAVSAQEFGELATLTSRHYGLQQFTSKHAPAQKDTVIFSDHNPSLYLMLLPSRAAV